MKKQTLLIFSLCMFPFIFFGQEGHVTQPGNGLTSAGLNAGIASSNSTYFGENAGRNSTGDTNTFIGFNTGVNDAAKGGVFVGAQAGYSNTSGYYNSMVGYYAGYRNTEGDYNTFLGTNAGFRNTIGSYNTFLGMYSGSGNDEGSRNTFIGYMSGRDNISGHQNVIIGDRAGIKNQSGYFNTFLGNTSGYYNTEGSANTFLGSGSGYRNSTGEGNVIIGYRAGSHTTEGNSNTIIGKKAGYKLASGSGNLFLGNLAGYHETESENKLIISNSATTSPLIYGDFSEKELTFNGNVGIDTKNFTDGTDTYRLAVNGKVRAKEIKVDTEWSDFVFEKEYNLPTLKEVEKHIKDKGHLKDIPSALEVAENGIFLGEMNSKLLQKIEELTLYTIQQQKDLEAQHQKNKSMEARMEALEIYLKK